MAVTTLETHNGKDIAQNATENRSSGKDEQVSSYFIKFMIFNKDNYLLLLKLIGSFCFSLEIWSKDV